MTASRQVAVSGGFDDIRSHDVRFLDEAAKLGELTVVLWPDETIARITGRPPRFPLAERHYAVGALRFVSKAVVAPEGFDTDALPDVLGFDLWAEREQDAVQSRREFCAARGATYHVLAADALKGFPEVPSAPSGRRKVIVTGCYDWLHSGHVRFFEEASSYGDLYVGLGNDANIRDLKGEGHPLQPADERRYMVGAIRYVTCAFVSSGSGWLDAEPEIDLLRPDVYIVNEDGDAGGKREFCARRGIEYLVLRRLPAPGLPQRSSTDLRGF